MCFIILFSVCIVCSTLLLYAFQLYIVSIFVPTQWHGLYIDIISNSDSVVAESLYMYMHIFFFYIYIWYRNSEGCKFYGPYSSNSVKFRYIWPCFKVPRYLKHQVFSNAWADSSGWFCYIIAKWGSNDIKLSKFRTGIYLFKSIIGQMEL